MSHYRSARRWVLCVTLVPVLVVGIASGSFADESDDTSSASPATASPDTASPATRPVRAFPLGAGGALLYVDPVRGEIVERPTADQRAALQAAIRADRDRRAAHLHESSAGLRSFAVPGGVGVALEGRYTSSTVLRLRPDGSLELHCTDDLPTSESMSRTTSPRRIEKQ